MKTIALRVWHEPAVAIGVLTSVLLSFVAIVSGAEWDLQTIIGILAPTVSALGIRTQVTPTRGREEIRH